MARASRPLAVLLSFLTLFFSLLPSFAGAEPDTLFSWSEAEDGTARIDAYLGEEEPSVVLPDTLGGLPVAHVGKNAFQENEYLEEIVLPDTLLDIGSYAFAGCVSLTSVSLPAGLLRIEDHAFSDCSSLAETVLPDSLAFLGSYAFSYTAISFAALPDSLRQIGDNPFAGCAELTRFSLSANHPALELKQGVLFSRDENRLVCYPKGKNDQEYTVPEGVRAIGSSAFDDADFYQVNLPKGLLELGWDAFHGCSYLSSAALPEGLVSIPFECFSYCSRLGSVSLPSTIRVIGEKAFSRCGALQEINLPEGLTEIGPRAFAGCSALARLALPASLEKVGSNAFKNCDSLTFTAPAGSWAEKFCLENGLPLADP